MNYLDFVNKRQEKLNNLQALNEGFKVGEVDKALELITKLFKKEIKGNVLFDPIPYEITVDGKAMQSYMFMQAVNGKLQVAWTLNYLISSKSAEVYSIDFYDSERYNELFIDERTKTNLSIFTMGSSIVHFLPIIIDVVNSKNFDLTQADAKKSATKIFKESENMATKYTYKIGKLKYSIMEGLSSFVIEETFNLNINEAIKSDNEEINKYKKDKLQHIKNREAAGAPRSEIKSLFAEYDQIKKAIKDGIDDLEELKLAVKHSLTSTMTIPLSTEEKKVDDEVMDDPETAFKKMNKYVKLVTMGLQPSVIICGAPGVGKTYNIKTQLKANGYNEGHNLFTIKGKCTPRVLYLALYDYQRKGNIILIDDADGLVGPHAPEDVINILKAALDSTSDDEGRLVSYGISGKILDDEGMEVPKRFYYNGGVIILTNYNAGQLDTALRGRSYIQDIHFGPAQILERIKTLLPKIGKEFNLDMECKQKAYDYLIKLLEEKYPMDLSIRGFILCAKTFYAASKDDDWDEKTSEEMIKEQMRLQSARGGKKY